MKKSLLMVALMLFMALSVSALAEDIAINEENFPDAAFRAFVASDAINTTQDGVLTEAERSIVTNLRMRGKRIRDLTGIEYFPNLAYLDCSNNDLYDYDRGTLDVTAFPSLYWLQCESCGLNTIDVSGLMGLTTLICDANSELNDLRFTELPLLSELKCSHTGLTQLDLSGLGALRILHCVGCPISVLDLSAHTRLEEVSCYNCELTTLDLTYDIALKRLDCRNCQLTKLELPRGAALTEFHCEGQHPVLPFCYAGDTSYCITGTGLDGVQFGKGIRYDGVNGLLHFPWAENEFEYEYPFDEGLPYAPMDVHVTAAGELLVRVIELDKTTLDLGFSFGKGETYALKAAILPENATYRDLEWYSEDESVATVSESGLVTAVGPGETNVICRATDRLGTTAVCTVRVTHTHTPVPEPPVPAANADGKTGVIRCLECRKLTDNGVTIERNAVLTLPAELTIVQEDAFRDTAAQQVVIPAGVQTIGSGAFPNVVLAVFESGDVTIEAGAFGNAVWFICPADSRVSAFAMDSGITWFPSEED